MIKTEIAVITSSVVIFLLVLNLVRLRKLREEYSWLWLIAAIFYLVIALKPDLLYSLSTFFGITNVITALIFFSIFFIVLILIIYSVRLSRLTNRMKEVAQQIALLDSDLTNRSRSLEYKQSEKLKNDSTVPEVSEGESIQPVFIGDPDHKI